MPFLNNAKALQRRERANAAVETGTATVNK